MSLHYLVKLEMLIVHTLPLSCYRKKPIARISSGGALFPQKSWRPLFSVVTLKTQTANAADCLTVKIKQITRSDIATFLFSVHTITEEAKQ